METDKRKKNLNGNQTKRPGRTAVKNSKKRPENGGLKSIKLRETESKASPVRPESRSGQSDKTKVADPPEAFETMIIHYVDDEKNAEEAQGDDQMSADTPNDSEALEADGSSDLEKEGNHEKDVFDDSGSVKGSGSSTQEVIEKVENEASNMAGTQGS